MKPSLKVVGGVVEFGTAVAKAMTEAGVRPLDGYVSAVLLVLEHKETEEGCGGSINWKPDLGRWEMDGQLAEIQAVPEDAVVEQSHFKSPFADGEPA